MANYCEQRYNKGFLYIRQTIYNDLKKIRRDEDNGVEPCSLFDVTKRFAALFYMMILYNTIINTFAEVKSWNTYKTNFKYDEMKECARCAGINWDKLASYFSFEAIIANDGVDTQELIDAVTSEYEVTCCQ